MNKWINEFTKKERHRADWINKWIVEYRTESEPGWMWVKKMNSWI